MNMTYNNQYYFDDRTRDFFYNAPDPHKILDTIKFYEEQYYNSRGYGHCNYYSVSLLTDSNRAKLIIEYNNGIDINIIFFINSQSITLEYLTSSLTNGPIINYSDSPFDLNYYTNTEISHNLQLHVMEISKSQREVTKYHIRCDKDGKFMKDLLQLLLIMEERLDNPIPTFVWDKFK